ncbi:hypothetical protein JCM3774_001959 [Rhodotorula dairenensis]
MEHLAYPLSPPSSTSLPEHCKFDVPPVTDGPNTRARLAAGLEPLSGTAAPLPTLSGVDESGRLRSGDVYEPDAWAETAQEQQVWRWSDWETCSCLQWKLIQMVHPLTQHWCPTASSDPSMYTYHASERPALFREEERDRQQRTFSTATIIDHGSPPGSPPGDYFKTTETLVFSGSGDDASRGGQGVAGLGLTKDEWLRLGGFLADDDSDHPPPPLGTPQKPLHCLGGDRTPPAYPVREERFALPRPPQLPPPVPQPTAPTLASFQVPVRGPNWYSDLPLSLPLPAPRLLHPTPPQQLWTWEHHDDESAPMVNQTPTRSQRRRAPSPIQATRARPAPYPTAAASQVGEDPTAVDIAVSKPDARIDAPAGIVDEPLLTPIRAALAKYAEIPLPVAPPSPVPPPDGKKRKRHGRKMSADHIPRPRNAFILFRSHAITSGLIPRSIGVKDHKNISQIVGGVWRGLSEPERQQWEVLAEEEKRRHLAKYPNYAYRLKQKETPRAPPGQGKKAKAKAARMAAEYAALTGIDLYEAERLFCSPKRRAQPGTGSSTTSGDDVGCMPPPPSRAPLPASEQDPNARHRAREDRRMELIAQALLEGEQDDLVMQRVEQQLEKEMGPPLIPVSAPAPPAITTSRDDDIQVESAERSAPLKRTRSGPVTPHKMRTAPTLADPVAGAEVGAPAVSDEEETTPTKQQQQAPRRALYASPASSESTWSPSPFRRAEFYSQNGHPRQPISPASSDSPWPVRMQQQHAHGAMSAPMTRGCSGAGSADRKHPLSRSQSASAALTDADAGDEHSGDDLPAARRQKTDSCAALGVDSRALTLPDSANSTGPFPGSKHSSPGYAFPTRRRNQNNNGIDAADVPLFVGPPDSRHFSLGRWEVRKPSAAVPSRREVLAQQVEESGQEEEEPTERWDAEGSRSAEAVAPFLLKPSDFLIDAGLEAPPPEGGLVNPRATFLQRSESFRANCSGDRHDEDDISTEYGTAYSSSVFDTWHSDAASSSLCCYETAPSSSAQSSTGRMPMPGAFASKPYHPQGLFRPSPSSATGGGPSLFAAQQQQHHLYSHADPLPAGEPSSATATAGAISPLARRQEDLFHFGAEDLFAPPPPALSSLFHDDPAARTISSSFGDSSGAHRAAMPDDGGGEDEPFGLGLGIALPL